MSKELYFVEWEAGREKGQYTGSYYDCLNLKRDLRFLYGIEVEIQLLKDN